MKFFNLCINSLTVILFSACAVGATETHYTTETTAAPEKPIVQIIPPGQDIRFLVPESDDIKELRQQGNSKMFAPQNLWEYIDGLADHYISYGFQRLITAEYAVEKNEQLRIILDIYDMGTAEKGFGIYSSERSPKYNFISMGTQGYQHDLSLNFFKGRYYVKVAAFEISESVKGLMKQLAQLVAEKISQPVTFPKALYRFPEVHRVKNSEQYIAKTFLGQSKFDNVYTVDYKIDKVSYTLIFARFPTQKDASEVFINMQKQTTSITSPIRKIRGVGDRAFKVVSKYHKAVVMAQKKSILYGGFNTSYPEEVIVQMQKIRLEEI